MKNQTFVSADGHLENRFNGTFTRFVFDCQDQDRSLLIDLFNSATAFAKTGDFPDDLIKGRIVRFIPNPYLTEVFFRKEHSWIMVGDALSDKGEQASLVLQTFRYPAFDLQIFGEDFNQMLDLRDGMPPVPEATGLELDPQRPVIVVSILKNVLAHTLNTAHFHMQMRLNCKGTRLGSMHQFNCRNADRIHPEQRGSRLELWTDFLSGRNPENFAAAARDDPVLSRLSELERQFMSDPRLLREYSESENEMNSMMSKTMKALKKRMPRQENDKSERAVLKNGVFTFSSPE